MFLLIHANILTLLHIDNISVEPGIFLGEMACLLLSEGFISQIYPKL